MLAAVCCSVQNVAIIGGLLHYLASCPGTRHKNRYERTMDALRQESVAQVLEARVARGAAAGAAGAAQQEQPQEDKKGK